jgi:hypothetical protein
VKKNGIMLVDFALAEGPDHGLSREEAIHRACLMRLGLTIPVVYIYMGRLSSSMKRRPSATARRLSSLGLSEAIGLVPGISRDDLRPNGDFAFLPPKSRLLRG